MTQCCSQQVSEDVSCLRTALFEDAPGIVHGFFGRKGGVSTGVYAGLNCGQGSNDDPESIAENRARVAKAMGTQGGQVVSLYQIHSAQCLNVSKPFAERPQGDAVVTDVPGIALSVLTADCAPVLFYGVTKDGKPVIGAAHAGWKGAIGGVLENTVDKMVKEYGAEKKTIRAAIGPTIQKKSYEVSGEFYENFVETDEAYDRFFQAARKAGHYMFDLPGFCAYRLSGHGVGNVQIVEKDTYGEEAMFYSYRRATHRGEKDYGRQISAVLIKP